MQDKQLQEDAMLWSDRKRILGMPISFTKYEVSQDRLVKHKGFFSTETDELLLYRILDIKMKRTLWQKIFGVGSITLFSADQSHQTLVLENVKKPDAVRHFLSKIVEQQRGAKGITGREIYGASGLMGGQHHAHAEATFVDVDGDGIPD